MPGRCHPDVPGRAGEGEARGQRRWPDPSVRGTRDLALEGMTVIHRRVAMALGREELGWRMNQSSLGIGPE